MGKSLALTQAMASRSGQSKFVFGDELPRKAGIIQDIPKQTKKQSRPEVWNVNQKTNPSVLSSERAGSRAQPVLPNPGKAPEAATWLLPHSFTYLLPSVHVGDAHDRAVP